MCDLVLVVMLCVDLIRIYLFWRCVYDMGTLGLKLVCFVGFCCLCFDFWCLRDCLLFIGCVWQLVFVVFACCYCAWL